VSATGYSLPLEHPFPHCSDGQRAPSWLMTSSKTAGG